MLRERGSHLLGESVFHPQCELFLVLKSVVVVVAVVVVVVIRRISILIL